MCRTVVVMVAVVVVVDSLELELDDLMKSIRMEMPVVVSYF